MRRNPREKKEEKKVMTFHIYFPILLPPRNKPQAILTYHSLQKREKTNNK